MRFITKSALYDEASPDAGGGGGEVSPVAVSHSDAELAAAFDAKPAAGAGEGETKPAGDAAPAAGGDDPAAKAKADAEAKAAAEKAGVNPEDKITLDPKANASTKTHFEELKRVAKAERAAAAELRTKIAELEKKVGVQPQTTPEIEKLRGEHKAFSDRLAILDLQNHPNYQREFVEPKNKLVAGLNDVLKENGVENVNVASFIGLSRVEFAKKVSEIAEKLPAYEQAAFMADMRQIATLDAKGKEALANAGELAKGIASQSSERAKAAFDTTWKSFDLEKNVKPLEIPATATAEERATLENYNKGLGEIRTAAEKYAFGQMDESSAASMASKAAAFDWFNTHAVPRMQAEHNKAVELIKSLTEEIKALRGARESGGGGGGGGGDAQTDEGHAAAANKVWGGR